MGGKKEPTGSFFHCSGFTLIELVVILVILGVISILAMARLTDGVARTRAFYDELLAQVQYARKAALAQRRAVFVRIEAANSRLCYSAAGACTGADGLAAPSGGTPFTVTPPAGISATAATFQFDALGRPRDTASVLRTTPLVISVTGDGSLQFTVEHDTGYVRP